MEFLYGWTDQPALKEKTMKHIELDSVQIAATKTDWKKRTVSITLQVELTEATIDIAGKLGGLAALEMPMFVTFDTMQTELPETSPGPKVRNVPVETTVVVVR